MVFNPKEYSLTINSQILKNYFIASLLFLLVFSYGFLPVYYLPFQSLSLLIFSFLILIIVSLNAPKKSLGNMDPFVWYLIFLVWYSVRLFFSGQLQIVQVDFRPIFLLNTATLFFCTYYSYLREYVIRILFLAGIIYMGFSINTFYSLISSNSLEGFVHIFALTGLDDSGEDIYQNIGIWFAILLIISGYLMNVFFKKSKTKFFLFSIPFSFSFVFLLLIGARAAFIGGIIGLIYLLKDIGLKNLFISVASISILLTPLILFNQDILLTLSRISVLFYGLDDSERIFLFSQAIDLWSQDIFTILFGGGIKSFPIFIGENNLGNYPHNIFLEVLCELGVVGLFIFVQIFYSAFRKKTNDLLMTSLTICMILIYSFIGGIHDLYNLFFFLALSIKTNVDYQL